MTDIVERLRAAPSEIGTMTQAVEHMREAADEIERLRAELIEKIEDTLWYAYNTGIEKPDGQWTHCFMSDGEDLIHQIGLDPSLGYYNAEQVKAAIPAAARAALEGKQ